MPNTITELVLQSPKGIPVDPLDPDRLKIHLDWVRTTVTNPGGKIIFQGAGQYHDPAQNPPEARYELSLKELRDIMGEDSYGVMKKESSVHGNSSKYDAKAVTFMDNAYDGPTNVADPQVVIQLDHFELEGFLSKEIVATIKAGITA